MHLHNRNDPAHVPAGTSRRTLTWVQNGQIVMTFLFSNSGSCASLAVERLPGFEHTVHNDGKLSGDRDRGALEPDLPSQRQSPGPQGAVGMHTREDGSCRLIKQCPQVCVTPARDVAVIVYLTRLIAPGSKPEPSTYGSRRLEVGRVLDRRDILRRGHRADAWDRHKQHGCLVPARRCE